MERLDAKWMKAAIVGGLWAAVEIIVGSFLHNLRVPMSGTILGANGLVLLIAFDRYWGESGMIWRAGLITALMKSVSPSAVILGPMIGILSEAVFLELGIRIFGRNPLGYLIGGILAILSILVHKVVSLLILYGFDIVEVYLNLFLFAAKQVKMPDADPMLALLVLVGIYIAIGMAAALIGMRLSSHGREGKQPAAAAKGGNQLTRKGGTQQSGRFSVSLLVFHLLAIPAVLILIQYLGFRMMMPFTLVYILLVFFRYPMGFRRVRKPVFWVQLLLLTLLAGLFFEGVPGPGNWINMKGIMTGLEMSLRAIFIVASFSGISAELANPKIRAFLAGRGFRQIYLSMEMAFAALPEVIQTLPSPKMVLLHPGQTFRLLLRHADEMLERESR